MQAKYYTGKGDKGKTNICGCDMPKDSMRAAALGEIDELNSFVGLSRSFAKDKEMDNILNKIQSQLFVAGAYLAGNAKKNIKISETDVKFLENTIEKYAKRIKEVRNFICPAGAQTSALLHVCRAVCRRAERSIVALSKKEKVNENLIPYFNRLSSLLFVIARFANKEAKVEDEVWKL